jgi:hypothetical protein
VFLILLFDLRRGVALPQEKSRIEMDQDSMSFVEGSADWK